MQFAIVEDAHPLERLVLVIRVLVVDDGKADGHTVVGRAHLENYLDLIHIADVGR